MDRSKVIFGNSMPTRSYNKACKKQKKYIRKFGDDRNRSYPLVCQPNETVGEPLGVVNLKPGTDKLFSGDPKGIIVGNIRMGYGHYRISIAMASAAHAMGYTPYWLDFNSFDQTCGGKIIAHQNDLYSLGSRLSQRFGLFNRLVWEPMNSEGFRRLSYNCADQKNAELMAPILSTLPKNMPYVATHAWPAQAAIHAGMTRVVNAIPDNWPMALHLAEGSIHTVQTPSAYLGYKVLRGMDKKRVLSPMPEGTLFNVGHYVDHEIVSNIEADCAGRMDRMQQGKPRRILLTIGGAGAQKELFSTMIRHLLPLAAKGKVALLLNIGDHLTVWEELEKEIPGLKDAAIRHFDQFAETAAFCKADKDIVGIHVFYHKDIFPAVYSTNLLMRICDILVTKPSELSFYPVPKLMIHRVGGHEAWGAIRAAEVGDGTFECDDTRQAIAMLDQMVYGKEILEEMCKNICTAHKAGIYNGAYRVIELATKQQ